MAVRVPLSKYDYGWYREAGVEWGGSVGAASTGAYYGPPYSLYYPMIAIILKYLVLGALAVGVIYG